jgi:hypothetical protein
MDTVMSASTESILEYLCWQSDKLLILVVLSGVGVLLTLISLLVYELPSATEFVAYLNLLGLFVLIGVNGGILLKCHRR